MNKVFQKTYTSRRNEEITLTWEQGYNNLRIFEDGIEIAFIPKASSIYKGVQTLDERNRKIELKFSDEKPITVDVRIDRTRYKPKGLKKSSSEFGMIPGIYWTFGVLLSIFIAFSFATFPFQMSLELFIQIFGIEILAAVIYVISGIFTSKGKAWAYFLGAVLFSVSTLHFAYINQLRFLRFDFILLISFAIRTGLLYVIWSKVKIGIEIAKDAQQKKNDDLLLDN